MSGGPLQVKASGTFEIKKGGATPFKNVGEVYALRRGRSAPDVRPSGGGVVTVVFFLAHQAAEAE